MARMKVCPECRRRNRSTVAECDECKYPLEDVRVTVDPPVSDPEPVGDPDGEADPRGQGSPRNRTRMDSADDGARATLVFEKREIAVPPEDSVRIGRDPEFSKHAEWIAGNAYVSRRHAEVFMKSGFLHVRHLSKTNPTYHNENPLTKPGASARLSDGDRIGFSRHLVASVRLG